MRGFLPGGGEGGEGGEGGFDEALREGSRPRKELEEVMEVVMIRRCDKGSSWLLEREDAVLGLVGHSKK